MGPAAVERSARRSQAVRWAELLEAATWSCKEMNIMYVLVYEGYGLYGIEKKHENKNNKKRNIIRLRYRI